MDPTQTTEHDVPPVAPTPIRLVPGLPPERLREALRGALRLERTGNRTLAFYLADMETRGLHRKLGFRSVIAYGVLVLKRSRRTIRELVRAGHALAELPRIDAAFGADQITWSATRLLVRVATADTEEAWLELAKKLPIDELEREVASSRKGSLPRKDPKGILEGRFRVSFSLTAAEMAVWENARRKISDEYGEAISDSELATRAVELILTTSEDGSAPP